LRVKAASLTPFFFVFKTRNNDPDNRSDVIWRAPRFEPAPVRADSDGKYPVPQPGRKTDREY
jgi:hypothetical protein